MLGNSPAQNLSEFIRKFPNLFLEDDKHEIESFICSSKKQNDFNNSYYAYCNRLAETTFRFKTSQNLSLNHFLSFCPEELKTLFQIFERSFTNQENFNDDENSIYLKTFLYITRGIFHRKLSIAATEFELFHLFLCLLSPHYELDQDALMRDLLPIFIDRGGVF